VSFERSKGKVGFGVSEAVSGGRVAFDEEDECARETDGGMRCCNLYLGAQRNQRM
jgi:hypothetical protein